MSTEEKYKNLKKLIQDIQNTHLDDIANLILADYPVSKGQLRGKNRSELHSELRRKISYLARVRYNIAGKILSEYLNISPEQISGYVHTAHDRCKVDKIYAQEIAELLDKLR